ncbi:hypothetical protein GQ457_04G034370 [Hibiscus cannabinus]
MASITWILFLSFALVQSVVGRAGHITSLVRTNLGPAAQVAARDIISSVGGEAVSPAQLKKSSAIISSAAGNEISPDQLKKIGKEIKEAFKNIENDVSEEISPEQEQKLIEEMANLAPSPDSDAPFSDDVDDDAPSNS